MAAFEVGAGADQGDEVGCVQEATVQLKLDGTLLRLPPRLAQLVLEHLEHAEAAWESNRAASTTPWLFAGLNPARPIQAQYIYLKLRRLGLCGLAGRNTARLALAADIPASILAALTGTSIDNATGRTSSSATGPTT